MEDEQTPATPRKRATKAKPSHTSNPSATAEPAASKPRKAMRPHTVPPATFVSPGGGRTGAHGDADKTATGHAGSAAEGEAGTTTPGVRAARSPEELKAGTHGNGATPSAPTPGPETVSAPAPAKKAARKAVRKVAEAPVQDALPGVPGKAVTPARAPRAATTARARKATPAQATPPAAETTAPAGRAEHTAAPAGRAEQSAAPAREAEQPAPPGVEAEQVVTAAEAAPLVPVAAPRPAAAVEPHPTAQPALWATLKANPGYAPELLALAAVAQLAPQVRAHLTWLRDTYPSATPDALARLAAARSVRRSRVQGGVAGLVGPLAVLAETGVLLWTQTRLVLDIAAAYGRDPADPERAAEVLAFQQVHPDLGTARAVLAAARKAAARKAADNSTASNSTADNSTADNSTADNSAARIGAASNGQDAVQLAMPVVRVAGRALGRMTLARRAARIVPGAGAALTAILDGRSTEMLAARATKFYRG